MASPDIPTLLRDIELSTLRWAIGLGIGAAIAFLLAVVFLLFGPFRRALLIPINFLRAIPILALVPIVGWYFAANEMGKELLIAWAVVFPMFLTATATINTDMTEARLVLLCAKVEPWNIFTHLELPALWAGLAAGFRVSIGIAWISVVAAETLGVFSTGFWGGGLGWQVMNETNNSNWPLMLEIDLIFGCLGLATDFIVVKIMRLISMASAMDISA